MKVIRTFQLPLEMDKKLEQHAAERGFASVSTLIRQVLNATLRKRRKNGRFE